MNMQNNKYYICSECYEIVSSNNRKQHSHQQSLSLITDLHSQITYLFENTKPKLENISSFKSIYTNSNNIVSEMSSFTDEIKRTFNVIAIILNNGQYDKVMNSFNAIKSEWSCFIKDKNKTENNYIDIFNKYREDIRKINIVDKEVGVFNQRLENFMSNCVYRYDEYVQLRDLNVEKFILANNSNLGTIIKERFEKANNDMKERIEDLEKENKKLIDLNEKLVQYIESHKKEEQNVIKETKQKDMIDFNVYSKDIHSLLGGYLSKTFFNDKHYKILDQYDIASFIKISYEQMIELVSIPELSLQYYSSKEQMEKVINKKPNNDFIFASTLYNQWITTISNKLKESFIEYTYSHISDIISSSFFTNIIYNSYITKSKEVLSLKSLDLKKCEITDEDMHKILLIINASPKIIDLYLQNNKITDTGITLFFSGLKEGNKLKNIYFNNNFNITSQSIKVFKEAVARKQKIFFFVKIISFENNNCNDKQSKEYTKEIKKKIKIIMNV